jgi:hypothetical protein
MAFDLLEDFLAFLYATGKNPNTEDDVLNQDCDEETDEDCDDDELRQHS